MQIHYLQHVPFEGLASLEGWAKAQEHSLSTTQFYNNDPLPEINSFDWLVIMGGPMGIYEERKYPWLGAEKKFIEQAIQQGKVVVGICLGAQLIADVLGAKVLPNPDKEIGWFPIQLTQEAQFHPLTHFLPPKFPVFHWHGDTFELPQGALHLARSEGCINQAFIYAEKVLALQFHLETTPESALQIITHCKSDLAEDKYIQRPEEMLARETDFRKINRAMEQILNNLTEVG
jgi:GMP synthase-like glutamine amidotransferase